jgi:rhamnopyranosyl-N-acetylglucosaminyl-diphospho-decaprenol beta-1,3/1,4-galactofuranosyltransferase
LRIKERKNLNNNCALVVTYNRPSLVLRCLEALVGQKQKPDCIIIVDNGSSSDTAALLLENGYIDKDIVSTNLDRCSVRKCNKNNIAIYYILFGENQGPGYAFYYGMKFFHDLDYEWIWIMDDDGIPDNESLVQLNNYKDKASFLNSVVIDEKNHSNLSFGFYSEEQCRLLNTKNEMLESSDNGLIYGYAHPFNGTFISRDLINSIGYPLFQMYGWGIESEYLKRTKAKGFNVATVVNANHYHPRSRVQYTSILKGSLKLNIHKSPFINYLSIRNSVYIGWRYHGFKRCAKLFVTYSFYYVYKLDIKGFYYFINAFVDGIFAIWGREKKLQK